MKILHINSYYSTSLFYKNLFEYQIKNGIDIDVFVPVHSSFQKRDFDYGVYTTISKDYNKYDRILFHLKHYKIQKDIQCKYDISKYSLIHAHSLFSNGYIALKLKKKYGVSYIVAVRNTDVNIFFNRMIHLRKLGLEILSEAKQIIFLSETYKNHVIDKYVSNDTKEKIQSKISIIPNGIDDFWFNKIGVPKKEIESSRIRLLQVGDINKNKNVETTVKAIELLREKGINVELNVVGRVKDKKILNRIKDLDYVNYLGFKTKNELLQIYRENDIFVLPSIKETFGLVYAEAMSQGLPVIYTRGQGFDGQFQNRKVGYSVDCYSEKEIADRIIEVITNYELLSNNSIMQCIEFSWEIVAEKYRNIIEKNHGEEY